jgi:hypothetical protein
MKDSEIELLHTQVSNLRAEMSIMKETFAEIQTFMIKMAVNQRDLSKRVSSWPYIEV